MHRASSLATIHSEQRLAASSGYYVRLVCYMLYYISTFFFLLSSPSFLLSFGDGEKNLMEFAIAMQPNPFHCLSLSLSEHTTGWFGTHTLHAEEEHKQVKHTGRSGWSVVQCKYFRCEIHDEKSSSFLTCSQDVVLRLDCR